MVPGLLWKHQDIVAVRVVVPADHAHLWHRRSTPDRLSMARQVVDRYCRATQYSAPQYCLGTRWPSILRPFRIDVMVPLKRCLEDCAQNLPSQRPYHCRHNSMCSILARNFCHPPGGTSISHPTSRQHFPVFALHWKIGRPIM